MAIFSPTKENIKKASQIIKSGGIVSFPTETVYGLGADVFDPMAVAKIFEAKKRPSFDPLIVHISDEAQLHDLVVSIPQKAKDLMDKFWPGPLTIIFDKLEKVPPIVTSGLSTVAVRMPDHKIALDLIEDAGTPMAAPSANPFGFISPTCAGHVETQLGDKVDMIIDGGDCSVGLESTIVKIESENNYLLRPGGITIEEIEKVIGNVQVVDKNSKKVESPGQLSSHYSPSVPVKLVDHFSDIDLFDPELSYLFFKKPPFPYSKSNSIILSESGDSVEAASNLFSSLHKLDKLNKRIIFAEKIPPEGLGLAIMDRLFRAAKKRDK